MNALDQQERKASIKNLINIVVLEGAVLMLVVGVYLYTNNIVYLIGGVLGSSMIFGPLILRWSKAHRALSSDQSQAQEQGRE